MPALDIRAAAAAFVGGYNDLTASVDCCACRMARVFRVAMCCVECRSTEEAVGLSLAQGTTLRGLDSTCRILWLYSCTAAIPAGRRDASGIHALPGGAALAPPHARS
jgi:hypothetical protein